MQNILIKKYYQILLPHYDAYGHLHSICVTEHGSFIVEKEPLQIIKESIAYYGGSLDGALYGVKQALGDIHLPPLQICAKQSIYWFYIQGLTNKANIFISHSHVNEVRKIDNKNVSLTMKNGLNVTIPVSMQRMQKRIADTYCFSKIMESRTLPNANLQGGIGGINFDPDKGDYDFEN